MSGASATPLSLPPAFRNPPPAPRLGSLAPRSLHLDPIARRMLVFSALAAYAAASWAGLLANPPAGRVILALGVSLAGAAALAVLTRASLPLPAAWLLALAIVLTATATAAVAIGLPARLLLPGHWGDLRRDVSTGIGGLGNADYPYAAAGWSRLVILCGMPLWLGLASALAFSPGRRAGALRSLALIVLVAAYATAATVSPSGAPLLRGLVLLLLVAAWLWLPTLSRRRALAAVVLVLGAGLLAVPAGARLNGAHPWLDYRNWSWSWSGIDSGEAFAWDQNYGPLDWPRSGKLLLQARSDSSFYWRTAVLDRFDGFRWLQDTASGNGAVELPHSRSGSPFSPQTVKLNPDWIHEIGFTIKGLQSQLVVGAGTILSVHGLSHVAPTESALTVTDGPLTDGNSYTVRAYVPQPSPEALRHVAPRYPRALAPYTELALPRSSTINPDRRAATATATGIPNIPATQITQHQLEVPLWGGAGSARAARTLAGSAYGGVYQLAHRLTRHATTAYGAVERIERYLQTTYSYSEVPPQRDYPLRAFLFKDKIGYCQQFSGAMALMLRMIGVPARVTSGFAPGSPGANGTYMIRDFDAHSWVEVYFNGIGWVPFDPTPAAAPATSQATGLGARSPNAPPQGLARGQIGGPLKLNGAHPSSGGSPGSAVAWLAPLVVLVLLAGGGAGFVVMRAIRCRRLPDRALAEAQLGELTTALGRLRSWSPRGATLLGLERRLGIVAGPASAAYAAKLREARYGPGESTPPSAADRRVLRRELTAGLGVRARARALLAIPPGGPASSTR